MRRRQDYTATHLPFSSTPGIIQSIIKVFDPLQDRLLLCKLMHVSPIFRQEAEIALYRDIGFGMDIDQHHRFLNAISQFPRLGGLVQRYEFWVFDCARDITAETLAAFKFAMPLMVNLQEFRFTGDKEMLLAHAILPGINNIRQLKSLYWRGSTLDEEEISRFLSHERALTKLNAILTGTVVHEPSVRHLRTLTGNSWTIRTLLPGRNITELYWIPDLELYTTTFTIIQPALGAFSRIRILSFGCGAVDKLLSHILPYLTSVEILELITMTVSVSLSFMNSKLLIISACRDMIYPAMRIAYQISEY